MKSRLQKSATLEFPHHWQNKKAYLVLETKNTLDLKPGDYLTEEAVRSHLSRSDIDIVFILKDETNKKESS